MRLAAIGQDRTGARYEPHHRQPAPSADRGAWQPGRSPPDRVLAADARLRGAHARHPVAPPSVWHLPGPPRQHPPHPTPPVFEVYLAVLAAAGLCLLFVPETVLSRRRPTLRFVGLGVPEPGRGQFIAAAVAAFAAFALLGLFSSLVPGFIGGVLHQGSHAVQGAIVFGMFAVGTGTQVALSRFGSRRVVLAGLGLFLAALGLILAALAQASIALFLAGTVVGGVAVGAIFQASLATANRLAPPERRGPGL